MRKISEIVIHCSATPASMDIGADVIREWHVNGNGWSDIGYHFVIRRDGVTEAGRPVEIAGAHARPVNRTSIGVCMIGGGKGQNETNFTLKQWVALDNLLSHLLAQYPNARVMGHREADPDAKGCPSFDAKYLVG